MTHYRDSKTRAGRIVLVLGKCSAQMRRARVSVMETEEKEGDGRQQAETIFSLLGQATGAHNMHPAVL